MYILGNILNSANNTAVVNVVNGILHCNCH